MTEPYSITSRTPSAYYDPDKLCWKTSQQSLLSEAPALLRRLPDWGMTVAGALFALPTPEHLTSVPAGSASLPTPCSRDWKDTGDNTNYEAIAEKSRLAGVVALLPTSVAWGHKSHGPNWGKYETAITRWTALTRPPKAPTDERGLSPRFVEWVMGLPVDWVCGLGLSRIAELKALGNGVVPQQAALALRLLAEMKPR